MQLTLHHKRKHLVNQLTTSCLAEGCSETFDRHADLEHHSEERHLSLGGFELSETAFARTCVNYAWHFGKYEIRTIEKLFQLTGPHIESIISHCISVKKFFKYALVVFC